ncbi:hypothetical protein BELL_0156g00180 [Botrytis elliptica]|uniref:Uncharacterized protein n=1 Tax=Botrytis elliptica TaxID=278938 RepID=A0A4Z1JRK4_9HELO|nr:hypothetical protein BELL_0156g00180 [Botrytis elliptica]
MSIQVMRPLRLSREIEIIRVVSFGLILTPVIHAANRDTTCKSNLALHPSPKLDNFKSQSKHLATPQSE